MKLAHLALSIGWSNPTSTLVLGLVPFSGNSLVSLPVMSGPNRSSVILGHVGIRSIPRIGPYCNIHPQYSTQKRDIDTPGDR